MFMAAMVIVGFYFEKRRSIAATLAMCGSGVGMSTVAPLVTYLLEEFEWEQVLLLLSGAVLQAFVLGTFVAIQKFMQVYSHYSCEKPMIEVFLLNQAKDFFRWGTEVIVTGLCWGLNPLLVMPLAPRTQVVDSGDIVAGSLYRPIDANFNRRKKLILQRLEEDRKIGPQTCLIMQRCVTLHY